MFSLNVIHSICTEGVCNFHFCVNRHRSIMVCLVVSNAVDRILESGSSRTIYCKISMFCFSLNI